MSKGYKGAMTLDKVADARSLLRFLSVHGISVTVVCKDGCPSSIKLKGATSDDAKVIRSCRSLVAKFKHDILMTFARHEQLKALDRWRDHQEGIPFHKIGAYDVTVNYSIDPWNKG